MVTRVRAFGVSLVGVGLVLAATLPGSYLGPKFWLVMLPVMIGFFLGLHKVRSPWVMVAAAAAVLWAVPTLISWLQ